MHVGVLLLSVIVGVLLLLVKRTGSTKSLPPVTTSVPDQLNQRHTGIL